jgi:SPP1 gp7 family putative phage head morphogenesis protein
VKVGHREAYEYLEGFELFMAGTLARQAWGEHICMAKFSPTPNGSPETLIDDGVAAAAKVTAGWAKQILRALEPATTERAILSVLDQFENGGFHVDEFANIAAEKLTLGTMLGALDSQWERENDHVLEPIRFAVGPVPLNITGSSFDTALKHFDSQNILTRPAFDALAEGSKRRAFTVARIAKHDLIDTVHAELRRQLSVGSATEGQGVDLRDFRKFAAKRLESAGWLPASPSHVETIFRTNIVSAVSSGRFTEMRQPAVVAALPFWQILCVRDPRTRPTHKAAHGIVLPANDPFWKHAYPPFGFNCRCKVCARTKAWLERNSKSVGPTPKDLPDPGFDSGTSTLISVPDSALKPAPSATPETPAPAAPSPPGLGAPSPFPERPRQPVLTPPAGPVAPSPAGLGAPSPFVPYIPPTQPVPLPATVPAPEPSFPIPRPPTSLLPPSPFPELSPLAPLPPPPEPAPVRRRRVKPTDPAKLPTAREFAENRITVGLRAGEIARLDAASIKVLGKPITPEIIHDLLGIENVAGLEGSDIRYTAYADTGRLDFTGIITHPDGSKSTIAREYTANADGTIDVHHAYFKLSETARNGGMGKQILRRQVLQYDKLPVRKIYTEAAWDGQFVCPNMGFTTRSAEQFARIKEQFAGYLRTTFGLSADRAEQIAEAQKTITDLARVQFPDVGVTGALEKGITEKDALRAGKRFLLGRGNNRIEGRSDLIELQVRRGEPEETIFRDYLGLPKRQP